MEKYQRHIKEQTTLEGSFEIDGEDAQFLAYIFNIESGDVNIPKGNGYISYDGNTLKISTE